VIGISGDKPITSIKDLSNLKIRTLTAPILMATVEALGSSPANVAFAEVYTAIMQGTIDGIVTNSNAFAAMKFQEVAPHVLNYGLSAAGHASIVNTAWLESMPDELHDGVYEIMTTGLEEMYAETWVESTKIFDKDLESVYETPSDQMVADLEKVLGEIPYQFADLVGGEEELQKVIDWVAEYEQSRE